VATNNPDRGTQALGTVSADFFYGDAKGIALELQAILQRAVNWAVQLNFGPDAIPPVIEFDIERKADFNELMSAVEHKIPVSRDALYDYYKLPRPRDESDTFVRPDEAPGLSLADPGMSKKKVRPQVRIL
jgi:hypothetical protein